MFETVRKHNKVLMFVLFLLIIPSFVLFGVEGYQRFNEAGEVVARVAGQEIKQGEWDAMHRSETERLRAQMPTLDARLLDTPQARYAMLERLVRDRVLAAAADKSHLATGDARLARELQDNPAIAALRRADGTLDMERYRQLVGAQGMTPEMFEARVRADVSARQVLQGVAGTAFAPKALSDVALNAFYERREVQIARFDPQSYAAQVQPTDAEIESHYKSNLQQFQAPEQASVEYLVLDLDAVKKGIAINESDLRTYYEQNTARLASQEERRASHILINAPKSAPAAEREAAKAKAAQLLAEARKAPAGFAELAKKNSQDTGSAANGGDLDFFARGAMVKPFEDAAFALKNGEISDVVETDYGYHVIKLTDIRAPKTRSFEEMRPTLEAELKTQQAQRKYAEAAETFTNGVYEQPDSLKPVAERLKLELRTGGPIGRVPAPGGQGALANPKFLAALFSADALEKKRNTEAVEIGPSQLASGRVVQYAAARTLPLAEVRDRVRASLVTARSVELARQQGTAKLAAWKANPASAVWPAAVTVSRDQPQGQPAAVVDAALLVDAAGLPALTSVDLGAQGYAVLRVAKSIARPASTDAAGQQDRDQYAQWWSTAEGLAYYNLLKQRFKVEVLAAKPAVSADAMADTALR